MSLVEAIYRRGVFEPLEPVDFQEEQRVRLSIERAAKETPEQWLERVRKRRVAIFERQGLLPDSALEIAEDRLR